MDTTRFLTCLDADFALLRSAAAAADGAARVPSCPDWSADDLAEHTARVYLHKVRCIEDGAFPADWDPDLSGRPAAEVLDDAYRTLLRTFAAHRPEDFAATFYEPQQTVGFWIRRMAQETAIHRVDAELVAGRPVTPIAEDLAADGIDEVLAMFLGYGSARWADAFADLLAGAGGETVAVRAGGRAWTVTAAPDKILVADGDDPAAAAAVESDTADTMLRWLWNRTDGLPADAVRTAGDPAALERFHRMRVAATQ